MPQRRRWAVVIAAGIALALAITLFSPFASTDPDGLERVAEDQQFLDEAEDPAYAIIPDYTFPGVENEGLATVLSGGVGVLMVAALGLGLGYGMKALGTARRAGAPDPGASEPSTDPGS